MKELRISGVAHPRLVTITVILVLMLGWPACALVADALPGGHGGEMSDACQGDHIPRAIDLSQAVQSAAASDPQLAIAYANAEDAYGDVIAARGAFLPSVQFSIADQRYVPDNELSPVVVIGNTVLGGPEVKSAYGALVLSWNLFNSGRDLAALQSADAERRAAASGIDDQLHDTLAGVLQAYADLYEAQVAAAHQSARQQSLKEIGTRAEERYVDGHGSIVDVGRARTAALEAQEELNDDCRTVADKSSALARAMGISLAWNERLVVGDALPAPIMDLENSGDLQAAVEEDSAVVARREKLAAAQAGLRQALRSLGPSVTLSVRRDLLGQSVDSFADANNHIAPYDYQLGLTFQQELFPFTDERAKIGHARAEVRRAQAELQQSRLDTEKRLREALSIREQVDASYRAARDSLVEAQRVAMLTQSLYRAGRTDLDSVDRAGIDRDKAAADVATLGSRRTYAAWAVVRALEPEQFVELLLQQLHVRPSTQPQ